MTDAPEATTTTPDVDEEPTGSGANGLVSLDPPAFNRPPGQPRLSPPVRFALRRVLQGLATLWVVTFLTFMTVQALPGDVAAAVLGKDATPEKVAAIHQQLNLDDPLLLRYFKWLGDMLTGDFGVSTVSAARGDLSTTVWSQIHDPLINSLLLAGITLVFLVPCAIALGTWAALRVGRKSDHAISTFSLTLSAMPEFLLAGILTLIFFTWLRVLPPIFPLGEGVSPLAHPDAMVLPVLTLLGVNLAYTTRLVRASTINVLRQDQVTMARLNGFQERRVIRRNVLRNSLAPSIQAVALTAQYLVGGIVIVEAVFSYPGIGQKLVMAVNTRDIQMIMVIATILAAIYIAINVVADVLVMLVVPRLRTEGS